MHFCTFLIIFHARKKMSAKFRWHCISVWSITLNPPYKAISSNTVSNICDEVISLAGLAGKGFKDKSFRPTGATLAVSKGVVQETVMQVGR